MFNRGLLKSEENGRLTKLKTCCKMNFTGEVTKIKENI